MNNKWSNTINHCNLNWSLQPKILQLTSRQQNSLWTNLTKKIIKLCKKCSNFTRYAMKISITKELWTRSNMWPIHCWLPYILWRKKLLKIIIKKFNCICLWWRVFWHWENRYFVKIAAILLKFSKKIFHLLGLKKIRNRYQNLNICCE